MSKQTRDTKQIDPTVLEYVKAATASSDRARAVLLVMITASVLVFTVIWNTGGWSGAEGGWLDKRIELREGALALLNDKLDPASPTLSAEDRELYGRAGVYLKWARLDRPNDGDKDNLAKEIADLKKFRAEQIRMIRVPFFGVIFDMNDLGLFAGITFTVVLLWLTFSVARERRNLKLTFREAAERGQTKVCYDLLMMHQVLTVPPMRGHRFGHVSNLIPKLLYLVPAAVYYIQYKTDRDTQPTGRLLSPSKVDMLMVTNEIMLSLILLFTILCIILSFGGDKIWRKAFREAYPAEPRGDETGAPVDAAAVVQADHAVTP